MGIGLQSRDNHTIVITKTTFELWSYNTHVATYDMVNECLEIFGWYSQTTTRHIKQFAKELGLETSTINKKNIQNGLCIFKGNKNKC